MKSFKHILLLLTITILVQAPLNSLSQRRYSHRSSSSAVSYGANLGITISDLDPQNGSTTNSKMGYYIGGFFEYKFADKIGAQADLNFIQFGGQQIPPTLILSPNSPILNDVKTVDLSIYGIDLPLTAKYHFTDVYPEFYVCLGVSGTYIMKSQAILNKETKVGEAFSTSTIYLDATKKIQDMQACGIIGGGAAIPFKSMFIQVNISFHYGITDLSANNIVANNGFNSKYIKIGLGICF